MEACKRLSELVAVLSAGAGGCGYNPCFPEVGEGRWVNLGFKSQMNAQRPEGEVPLVVRALAKGAGLRAS
jgi:hypothetical protein